MAVQERWPRHTGRGGGSVSEVHSDGAGGRRGRGGGGGERHGGAGARGGSGARSGGAPATLGVAGAAAAAGVDDAGARRSGSRAGDGGAQAGRPARTARAGQRSLSAMTLRCGGRPGGSLAILLPRRGSRSPQQERRRQQVLAREAGRGATQAHPEGAAARALRRTCREQVAVDTPRRVLSCTLATHQNRRIQ